ncbi:MAG: tetratricopeptide repeat protein [Spirochaetes bacterium]|nr:tetratricopeptide repeat protein [Spirochaetota bacterium]
MKKGYFILIILLFIGCGNEFSRTFNRAKRLSKSDKLEDWEKSILAYDKVIKLKVNAREYQALVYRKMAKYHLEMEHYNDALVNFEKAAQILPNEGILHYYIGLCYSQLSRSVTDENKKIEMIKIAETEYKLSLSLTPDLIDPLYGLGIISFYVWNDYKAGIEYMAKVLEKDPKNIDAHFALARFYYEIGEPIKSLEFYKALVSLLPKNSERLTQVKNNIARIHSELHE